jgi:transposase
VSLQPMSIPPVPADTARLAKVVFKKGNLYMTIGDQIGYLFADIDFADLYAADGSPAISPARLALVTIFQFMEHVTDREAAELVRARIDWKYALRLPLDDTGFDFSVLSDFRERLVAHGAGPQLFGRVLVLAATLIEQDVAELNEQAGETKEGAVWLPEKVGQGDYCERSSSRMARLASASSRMALRSAKPISRPLRQTRLIWRATP